ncbi:MAG TPA: DegT/DnrJ/EryC1/StrS family aminotransferase [Labilithrix sp.]|nr:DegT/DnrJ/EryC1/StrS family aminotransferase [Labilithrix sp.]
MTVRVPLLDLKAQYETIRPDITAALGRVLESQHFILGPEVEGLEREIAEYSRVKHAIGVSSGTDAIVVALMALGVGPGDEVITTPHTFIATCSSIVRLGARPVFVDIDPASYNLDVHAVFAAVGPRTKAIMPVHLFGQMADTRVLRAVSEKTGVPIVEDGAQALGAELAGVRAGGAGALGTYSFFPSKNLGGFGDGGMVVSNDDALAARVRLLRNQGQSPKYFSIEVGGNFRLDALQAAILRAKLPHLDAWNDARARNAATYRRLLSASPLRVAGGALLEDGVDIALPVELAERRHVYHHFVIRGRERDALRRHLAERGIGSEVSYPQPMHLQKCFADLGHARGAFPEAERAADESLAIPVYPELSEAMQSAVVDAIAEFYKRA